MSNEYFYLVVIDLFSFFKVKMKISATIPIKKAMEFHGFSRDLLILSHALEIIFQVLNYKFVELSFFLVKHVRSVYSQSHQHDA